MSELAEDIYAQTSLKLNGYNITVNSDNIRHTRNKHSDEVGESERHQVALTPELMAELPEAYNKQDKISVSSNKDCRGKKVLQFEKN